ncbi:MAG TPA: hypothetical protein VD973_19550 [Symbiobacteriaceae bacterium]|nr:hypothetical protein [Symbiobacteriaceae bacterium]
MSEVRIYPEYISLLRELAALEGVSVEDQEALFSRFSPLRVPAFRPDSFSLKLQVDDPEFPFSRTADEGKIYELIGPNERNKTSTLIFIATLLGYDWEANRTFLQDPKVTRQAAIIKRRLSEGLEVSLELEDADYRAEVEIRRGEASFRLWDRQNQRNDVLRSGLRLLGETDWAEFRRGVVGFSDVQVVGVGRNFITQVGFEESENLTRFCEHLAKGMAEHMAELGRQKPKYPTNIAKLQRDRSSKRIEDLKTKKGQLEAALLSLQSRSVLLESLLQEGADLWKSAELANALRMTHDSSVLLQLESELAQVSAKLSEKKAEAAEFEQAASQQRNRINLLNSITGQLLDEANQLRPQLPLAHETIEKLVSALSEGRIVDVMSLLRYPPMDDNTPKAHDALANPAIWDAVGRGTRLLAVSALDKNCETAGAFELAMIQTRDQTKQLLVLRSAADTSVKLLEAEGLSAVASREKIEARLEALQNYLDAVNQDVVGLTAAHLDYKSRVQAIGTTGKELAERAKQHVDALGDKAKSWIEAVTKEGFAPADWDYGVRDSVVKLVSSLRAEHTQLEGQLRSCRNELDSTQKELGSWEQALVDSVRGDKIQQRMNALLTWQDKARAIQEYFEHRRNYLALNAELDKRDFEQAAAHLGTGFAKVIATLNERIRSRCPIAFANHGSNGVVSEKVLSFDFLTEARVIENVSPQASEHGGLNSGMTILGLASKESVSKLGSILLVDEYSDVAVYRPHIYRALQQLPHLRLGIFVRLLDDAMAPLQFKAWRSTT